MRKVLFPKISITAIIVKVDQLIVSSIPSENLETQLLWEAWNAHWCWLHSLHCFRRYL